MTGSAAPTRIPRPPRVTVEVRGALGLVGTLTKYLSLATLFPAGVAIGYGEPPWPFLAAGAIAALAGLALERLGRDSHTIGFREGFFVVAVTWLFAAAVGALPYLLSGEAQLDRPVDAYFEAMSGFTTTGASVLTDIAAVNRSLLMWRQFTQWLGGMGIIVLALAVLPRLRVGGRQLLESEMPGPEIEQLSVRIRSTAQRLWLLYVALTAAEALILAIFGWTGIDRRMGLFNAVAHAFTTLPTGGFSPEPRSLEGFSAASQWVVVVFMVLAGLNFALLYRAFVRRRLGALVRDEEARLFAAVVVVVSALLAVELWHAGVVRGEAAVRAAVFQVTSMTTTTGYASVDYVGWPALALMILVAVMFVGGSAGSTGGSIKVVRHLLLGKAIRREIRLTVHPEAVMPIRHNGAVVDERTLRAVTTFVLLYIALFAAGAAAIALDAAFQGPRISTLDAIGLSATTLGNVGPGFGLAGPMGSFAQFSDVSTVVMTLLMWLGRLEVIPIVVLFTRGYWRV
ncbi:Trk-type K+ transport system membrane component [Gaiella occulta]|uniref:Trk-type K+ transport system membrane component n=1 Tax=Gaiella occulta TaxID=1002870 RepID=A0A7M2YUB8_9ACTN|nr:Trk-type K+ transport system membrane component [Gaiella occulta]